MLSVKENEEILKQLNVIWFGTDQVFETDIINLINEFSQSIKISDRDKVTIHHAPQESLMNKEIKDNNFICINEKEIADLEQKFDGTIIRIPRYKNYPINIDHVLSFKDCSERIRIPSGAVRYGFRIGFSMMTGKTLYWTFSTESSKDKALEIIRDRVFKNDILV